MCSNPSGSGGKLVWNFCCSFFFFLSLFFGPIFNDSCFQFIFTKSPIIQVKQKASMLTDLEPLEKSLQFNYMKLSKLYTSSVDQKCLDPLCKFRDVLVAVEGKII